MIATVLTRPSPSAVRRTIVAATPVAAAAPMPPPVAVGGAWTFSANPPTAATGMPHAVIPLAQQGSAASVAALLGKRPRTAAVQPAPQAAPTPVIRPSPRASHDAEDIASLLLSLPHAASAGSLEARGQGSNTSGHTSPTSRAASPVNEPNGPQGEEDGYQRTKRRHNETERRRVEKLRLAYKELEEAVRSQPDLYVAITGNDANDEPDEVAPQNGKRPRANAAGSRGKSHIDVLQEASTVIRRLYSLVTTLSEERNQMMQAQAAAPQHEY